jgi:hypothetical protein
LRLSDLTVEVRDINLTRLGIIRPEDLNLTVSDKHNNVGSWSLKLASEHPLADALRTPGAGLIVTGPDDVLFSGPVVKPAFKSDSNDPAGTLVFEGVTDTVALSDALSWPEPTNPNPETQTASHDVRTGAAETLMYAYVNANIGPGAPLARQKAKLTLGTDGLRGPSLTKRARFPVLGNLLHELAVVSDLGFRVVQRGNSLVFETYAVADRTKTIRLDVLNGTLASQSVAVSAPGATRVIVAGQGELVERQFVARDNAESIEAETAWGRRIERFVDQRQTDVVDELIQAGDELLAEEGFTAVSVRAVPMDDTSMEFGKDWGLGDRVTVIVTGTESTAIVTGYVLRVDNEGLRLGAVLGDVADFDPDAALGKRVEDTQRRVSSLERSAATEGHTHDYAPVDASGNLALGGKELQFGINSMNVIRLGAGTDFNTQRPAGQYEVEGSATGTPNAPAAGGNWWHLQQFTHGNTNGYAWQVATSLNPGVVNAPIYTRRQNGGSWSAWTQWGGDTDWIELTGFINGASAYQTGLGNPWTPRYRKQNGVVYLEGLVNAGTTATVHICTLPAGFRPGTGTKMVDMFAAGPSVRRMDILSNGDMIFRELVGTGSTGWHNIGCSFVQEN